MLLDIAKTMAEALHFNTFGGNPMACATGSAVLEVLDFWYFFCHMYLAQRKYKVFYAIIVWHVCEARIAEGNIATAVKTYWVFHPGASHNHAIYLDCCGYVVSFALVGDR